MKKLGGVIIFLVFSLEANAQANTLASQFAMQAGVIAGTVQACGQNIVEYNARVVEAVNVLAKIPAERMQAVTDYQKALSDAQLAQNKTHTINCVQAIQSFNGLPLMSADYKKTVLPQLAQMANSPASAAPVALPPSTPPATQAK